MVGVSQRVFPVGRLDADSTGLLLMTNDGELAERVSHPRYGVPKTYRAHVSGRVTPEELAQLRRGIWLSDGKAQVAHAKLIHGDRKRSVLEVTLREGHNREVRRVLAKIGHPVRKLIRIQIGPLSLDGLGSRQFRPLRRTELRALRDACDPQRRPTKRAPASGARRPPKPSSPRSRKRARSRDRQGHRR
jgi:23S rRNA pseudouridine2605 synthase